MLIDCELMGSEKQFELPVRDVAKAWCFYRDVMGAQEMFRSEPTPGGLTRIGFRIGKAGFIITSQDHAEADDGWATPALLAADFGAPFAAIVIYVEDPAGAVQRALQAGSQFQPEAVSSGPSDRGHAVEVIIDPFGHSWAFAKSPNRCFQ